MKIKYLAMLLILITMITGCKNKEINNDTSIHEHMDSFKNVEVAEETDENADDNLEDTKGQNQDIVNSIKEEYLAIESEPITEQLDNSSVDNIEEIHVEDGYIDKQSFDIEYTDIDDTDIIIEDFNESQLYAYKSDSWSGKFMLNTLKRICIDNDFDLKSLEYKEVDYSEFIDPEFWLWDFENSEIKIRIATHDSLTRAKVNIIYK